MWEKDPPCSSKGFAGYCVFHGLEVKLHFFHYKEDRLFCEDVALEDVARMYGTPTYVYSYATLKRHYRAFDGAFEDVKHITCFSIKSNSNIAILRLMALEGAGMDIVSGGELYRALKAGVAPERIVYSGVGKTSQEMDFALKCNILMFNVESAQELELLDSIAQAQKKVARISLRVNPDVDPATHPYITTGLVENKFGIDIKEAVALYEKAHSMKNLEVVGISCHIGSQLTKVSPFVDALSRLCSLMEDLIKRGIQIKYLDIGGGLGIPYKEEQPPHPWEYAKAIKEVVPKDKDLTLILEPGRVIVGNAGVLLTQVLYEKETPYKRFFVVDAAMNDLIRPSLYGSYHSIWPVRLNDSQELEADIVGPICESGDFFAKKRKMQRVRAGEFLSIMSAGAYGFSMSSNYNSRPRAAEVLVKGDKAFLIRERETLEDLIKGEAIPKELEEVS